MPNINKTIQGVPGRAYLLGAVLIFAASNAVTRRLNQLGAQNLIEGRNPISFCNVLFVGNLCALMALTVIYGRQWNFRSLKQLSSRDWLGLLAVAFFSGTLAPALTFSALEKTSVNNVILVGRIEPPLALGLSVWLLRARVNRWVVVGAIISFLGVVLTVVIQPPAVQAIDMGGGFTVGIGELMAAGGAVSLAISTIVSQVSLRQIPLGIFTSFRTALSTVIFFILAVKLFGFIHFRDVFSPFVWQWMLVYGLAIVVGGQLLWFQGLKTTNASDISLASSFSPIAGILSAYLILGEVPTAAQYLGGSVIILGIILNQIGIWKQPTEERIGGLRLTPKEVEMETGFRGI